jgi:PadR family transcriptional regulator PadR
MKLENAQAQMRKGILEYCILSAIATKGEMYASDIIQTMKKAELIVVEGTLYPLLTRLKKANLLSYYWRESEAGPPRKYYYLTEEGKHFLQQLADTWQKLDRAVAYVTQNP